MSSSVSNISIRYHAEDEQLEELYEIDTRFETHSDDGRLSSSTPCASSSVSETASPDSGKGSSVLSRLSKRSSSLETGSGKTDESSPGDTWRLFREVRGRITKTVEEKIEEIKSERRLRSSRSRDRRSMLGQMENSSVSDSEDQSESSVSLKEPLSPEKTTTKTEMSEKAGKLSISLSDKNKEETDESVSQNSSPDRSVTPVPFVSVEDSEEQPAKKDKSKDAQKKQKLMPVNEEEAHSIQSLYGVTYSSLWDREADDERPLEIGLDAIEMTASISPFAEQMRQDDICRVQQNRKHALDWMKITLRILYKWRSFFIPVIAFLVYLVKEIPAHALGFMVGAVVVYEFRLIFDWFASVLGFSRYSPVQQSDLEPNFTSDRVPIFKNNIYRAPPLHPEKVKYEGWMNEFSREYSPKIYHISLTESVYVRLEGSTLRLSTPRSKIPKRAMWNEPKHKLLFNRDRLFDIANCRVTLLPDGLTHRRIWSKKYPICIRLLPLSRKGVRYRSSSQETVDETVPWLEEERYSAETASVDSDDSEEDKKSEHLESDLVSHMSDLVSSPDDFKKASELSILSASSADTVADDDSDDEFVRVSPPLVDETNLYLFARTDREKEIWYRRFVAAVTYTSPSMAEMVSPESVSEASGRKESRLSVEKDYLNFMLQLSQRRIPNSSSSSSSSPSKRKDSKSSSKSNSEEGESSLISPDIIWVNAFGGRLLYDVLQDPNLLSKIEEKIQRKLSAIRLPFFMEELVIRSIDFGLKVPIVQNVTRPELNSEGVWVDLNIFYEGGFKMVVDTKLNLMKLKQRPQVPSVQSDNESSPKQSPARSSITDSPGPMKSAMFDSDIEDSAETSSEEPDIARLASAAELNTPPAGGKYMRILDKFAQSKYFQQMTDYKFVKTLMEGVSNTNIALDVEVKGLAGTLVLNFPPPPSDRLWYGFRTNPQLSLSAHPKFGERAVTIMHITKLIEKKLCLEFQKILVLPNMDDLLIPLMNKDLPS